MSGPALEAGIAGMLGVLALWELLAAVERTRLAAWAQQVVGPLRQAGEEGRHPTPPERRRLALVASVTLGAAAWLAAGPWVGLVAGAAGPWTARGLVATRRARHRRRLARTAPGVARALADALGGGHAVPGALREAARGAPAPAAEELGRVARALDLGTPVGPALEELRVRAASPAYDTLVAAVLLQRDAGGPLAGLLRRLAGALEESARLEDDARAATAQARFTAGLVCALPVGAAGLAELASPGYVRDLAGSPLTAWLAGMALLLQAGALLAVRRLARVRA